MVKYGVSFGYYDKEIIEMEERTTDYGSIVDILIDRLEENGYNGFIEWEETQESGNKDGYYDDEYITGGNHGLVLYHGGIFYIEEIK